MSEKTENSFWYRKGLKDGIPIGLGYFAVAFTLGIVARKAGMLPWQAALMSFATMASAGGYVIITVIASCGGYIQIILATFIVNLRYTLMSSALSQKFKPDEKFIHRFLVAGTVTDEIFGISSNVEGKLNPFYNYGAMTIANPCWTAGTFLGAAIGAILPPFLESAMGVALYGMFLSIVIPPARKNKIIAGIVAVSFALSLAFAKIPLTSHVSEGMRITILTIVIASLAALIFPVKDENPCTGETSGGEK